jgi:para-nitrobenzyl esterase
MMHQQQPVRKRAAATSAAILGALILVATPGGAIGGSEIQSGTLIHLADGDVQGQVSEGTRQFLGIPYAAPPVGGLRWRPPAPPVPWQSVLDASSFGPACAQLASIQGPASDEEDCLYLNVWTPDPAPKRPLPVMVWFHGGANQQGAARDPVPFPGVPGLFYDGRVLAREHGVVVVTIDYRLNVFGFFAHAALVGEDPSYPHAGNQGLLDQRAALEWVRANIVAFGGNPKKVTIFGESAGSQDVCLHMAAGGKRKLFRRVIGESGGCTTRTPTAAQGAATATAFATAAGCGAGDQLACLRQMPASALLAILEQQGMGGVVPTLSFGPVVDGGFLPDQPRTLFDDGRFVKVPYVLGSNTDEGTLFFLGVPPVTTEAEYLAALQARYGGLANDVAAVYPASSFASPQDALARAFGDQILVCPTYDTARRAAAGHARTYLYNFSREIPIPILQQLGLGAFHGSEIPYVFGSITPPTPDDAAIGETMRGYWTRFADRGNPNGKGALRWPRYRERRDERIDFDVETSVLTGFRHAECEFWWGVYDAAFIGSPSGAFVGPPAGRG